MEELELVLISFQIVNLRRVLTRSSGAEKCYTKSNDSGHYPTNHPCRCKRNEEQEVQGPWRSA